MHTQLYSYFNENFLNDQQHGFKPNMSTSTAVFDMLKESFKCWNDKTYQTCIFIDFSRAFDCIDHKIQMLSKLKLYGLDTKAVAFLSSYFSNRNQITCIGRNQSSMNKVKYGTAQGSMLGPLILIIYVNGGSRTTTPGTTTSRTTTLGDIYTGGNYPAGQLPP